MHESARFPCFLTLLDPLAVFFPACAIPSRFTHVSHLHVSLLLLSAVFVSVSVKMSSLSPVMALWLLSNCQVYVCFSSRPCSAQPCPVLCAPTRSHWAAAWQLDALFFLLGIFSRFPDAEGLSWDHIHCKPCRCVSDCNSATSSAHKTPILVIFVDIRTPFTS